ncbi:unnamed protein product [Arabidopsis thaliana]|uniref:(thale cress) hypothetical protein n=1 Tax=Arabidopsis thaliana TaxID=3702 RepID=A0A7G2E597_ARATH|nr:unnamed protein product [Arabidopsis thaliana]
MIGGEESIARSGEGQDDQGELSEPQPRFPFEPVRETGQYPAYTSSSKFSSTTLASMISTLSFKHFLKREDTIALEFLVPSSTVFFLRKVSNIGVMSYTFHFTSKIPKGIMDRDSPLWNKDMQCIAFNQADCVLETELTKMSETPKGIVMDFIGEPLSDLAQTGKIDQGKLDSFKTSFYFAELGEIRQIIEENVKFTIEDIIHSNNEFPLDLKILPVSFKAFSGAFISAHFR